MVRFLSLAVMAAAAITAHAWNIDYAVSGMASRSNQENPDIDSVLATISERENRTLPKQFDANLRLDKISALPGRRLVRQFTVLNHASAFRAGAGADVALSANVKAAACQDKDLLKFFRSSVSVVERYQDADGQPLGEVSVSPADCSGKA